MQLSVIIVNFRTFELTCNCIRSIHQHVNGLPYEIILVDNAPVENKEAAFKSLFPELIYLKTAKNVGFAGANNLGMTYANGRYLLLLNSDTLVFDNSIQRCVGFMENDAAQEIGVLGCKLLNENQAYQTSFYPFRKNTILNYLLTNNILLAKLFRVDRYFKETGQVLEVGDVSGAFMLLRKKVAAEVGAFDPDFFLYFEETEWCRERIGKRYKVVYYPLAAIIHLGGKSAPQAPMLIQSKISLALLWYKKGWLHYILYCIFSHLNILFNLLVYPFVQKRTRKTILRELNGAVKAFPYLFTEVTKYNRALGSRNEPLVYEGARAIFFGNGTAEKAMVS